MSKNFNPTAGNSDRAQEAKRLEEKLKLLMVSPMERAHDIGRALNQIKEQALYVELGASSFEEYLKHLGYKRSTAYVNMRLAATFDVYAHGQLGVCKLRLLCHRKIKDPLLLIEQGVPVDDGSGGEIRKGIQEMSTRELQAALKRLVQQPAPTPIEMEALVAIDTLLGNTSAAPADLPIDMSESESMMGDLKAEPLLGQHPPADFPVAAAHHAGLEAVVHERAPLQDPTTQLSLFSVNSTVHPA